MKAKKTNSLPIKLIFTIVLFLIVGVIFLFKNNLQFNVLVRVSNPEIRSLYISTISELNSKYNSSHSKTVNFSLKKTSFVWQTTDGFDVWTKESPGIVIRGGSGFEVSQLEKDIEAILVKNGFVENKKGDVKCSFISENDQSNICYEENNQRTLTCSSDDLPLVDPLRSQLDLKHETIVLSQNIGKFYPAELQGFMSCAGPPYALVKNENDKYRMIFVGQEAISCSLVKSEKIPKEVISTCLDNQGKEVKNTL